MNNNARLEDIYTFRYGKGNTIESNGGPYPIYGSNGAVGFTDKYNSEDAPVIGHIGAYAGIVNWASGKHFVTYNGVICKVKDGVDPKYGYYALLVSRLQDRVRGSTQPFVSYDLLNEVNIRLVDPPLQRKISAVLSVLDDKIELNRKINSELEQMARTLYDYWFVQFDFPDASGKPYKSSGGSMKFSPELNREIPEVWKVQNMYKNDVFKIIKPKIDKFSGTKRYIATADVNGLNISDGSPITYENRESRANMQPEAFTVWFAKMKNSVKHVFVSDYSEDLIEKSIFSTGFMGLQTKREAFEYVALTVHRPYFELVKDSNSSGATMEAIGNSAMANMKLIIPDDRTLKMFYEVARPLLEKIDKNRQESQNLAHLRDWLLPMLMNGQVGVE